MPKSNHTTIVFDGDGHPFAVNRRARRYLKSKRIEHTPVPMSPLHWFMDSLVMHGDEFVIPYQAPKKSTNKY